jgi:hypothetical protein
VTSIISRVPSVLDYLVATFTAAPSLGAATSPVAVYDGPVVTETPAQLILWVGLDDPDADGAVVAAESVREWAGLGGQSELITVHCAAAAWSGNDPVSAMRAAAYSIVAAVETLVRADTSGFGGNAMLADPGVTASVLSQDTSPTGTQAVVSFQIVLKAL